MSVSINGTSGLTFNDNTTQATAWNPGWRNRIINGDMRIDQRRSGASVTQAVQLDYLVDRWVMFGSVTSKMSAQQNAGSVTPPTGFANYLGFTSLSSYTVGASELFLFRQPIEGVNIADLAWGTSAAASITLSFKVRSSLTGTFGGALQNSAQTRSYPFSYTISSANTWTDVSITIPGDTSGTWLTTTGVGIFVTFGLGCGSTVSNTAGSWANGTFHSATGAVSVVGTNGATFYITGVQLEKGSTATSFEQVEYGEMLRRCQRYCIVYGGDATINKLGYGGSASSTTTAASFVTFPVQMRAVPTFSYSGSWQVSDGVTATAATNITLVANQASSLIGMVNATVASGLTQYRVYWVESASSSASKATWSSEL